MAIPAIRLARRTLMMQPAEVQWRIKHAATVVCEKLVYRLGGFNWSAHQWRKRLCRHASQPPPATALALWWHDHMRTRQEPPFLLSREALVEVTPLYRRCFDERLESTLNDACRLCQGKFSFLGLEFQTDPIIDWQRDPCTGKKWPATFYADVPVPFCDGTGSNRSPGDSKHVWELNRHEYLVLLAKSHFLSGDAIFARRIIETVGEWSAANPYLTGINWAGPLEVALRAIAWLWSYQFCRSWEGMQADEHLTWIKSFYQHGAYLYRHLEVYSSPNNHLVGEATALYLLGSFFPEFSGSSAWRDRAWSILKLQPAQQFYADGGSTEQATSYHHYCLGFFLLLVLTRMRQGLPIPTLMSQRLEAAFEFSMWMTTPDGTVPRIGDTDDARSIRFGPVVPWDFRNLLAIGAVLFQRGDFKAIAETFSEDALWLLGADGFRTFQELPFQPPPTTSRTFSHSGYAVLRDSWYESGHYTCLDCGEIGRGLQTSDVPIFTHGHADMLSFNVAAFGKPILVDSGFYTYNGCPEWHQYTRDVTGHNTLRLDGQSQAKFHVKNAWSCVSLPTSLALKNGKESQLLVGSHNGFVGVKDCSGHRRVLAWNGATCWLILDQLEGSGLHYVEVFFHFAPGRYHLHADRPCISIVTDGGNHTTLESMRPAALNIDARRGEAEPDGGWIAEGYGRKVPAPVVRFYGQVCLPCTLPFVLNTAEVPTAPPAVTELSVDNAMPDSVLSSLRARIVTSEDEELLNVGCAETYLPIHKALS